MGADGRAGGRPRQSRAGGRATRLPPTCPPPTHTRPRLPPKHTLAWPGLTCSQYFKREHPGIVSSVGVPSRRVILSSCCASSAPGKRGRPSSSSAKMQPTDHRSTSGPYRVAPSSSSGGRYHSVITRFVNSRSRAPPPPLSWRYGLARPKSASLSSPALLISRLEAFRSRCSTFLVWQ